MTEAYISILSGKQCYLGLVLAMESWLREVLSAHDPEDLPSEEELHDLWVRLGCDVETIEILVEFRVVFVPKDNKLLVSSSCID
eukprot:2366852-Amphidinium_carterae.1